MQQRRCVMSISDSPATVGQQNADEFLFIFGPNLMIL
jgi:hypothetical protein